MDIGEAEHRTEALLSFIIEATCCGEMLRVVVRAEHHVPPWEISIVVLVSAVLVMDAMHLGALENEANPPRSRDIGVVEELTECSERGVDGARLEGQPKDRIHDHASDDRVDDHF